jgi:UPF0755 protein
MSDQHNNPNDSYNELLKRYSASQQKRTSGEANVPPAGTPRVRPDPGISFNRPNNEDIPPKSYRATGEKPVAPRQTPSRGAAAGARPASSASSASRPVRTAAPKDATTEVVQALQKRKKAQKKRKKRAMRRRSNIQSFLLVALVLVFVFVASMLLKIPIMGCVNDLLATDRSDTQIRVVIEDGMNVDEIIDLLAEKGLIYSAPFCKLAASLLDYSKTDEFQEGTYDLSSDMGLEMMLNKIQSTGVKLSTVTLTFPEGYTVDQIISKLSENNVASKEALYEILNGNVLVDKYDFLTAITDRADRYSIFEGYLYPDTYEFYIGEEPESVFDKFLRNFDKRWTSEYDDNAAKLGMTVDEVITLASILEKEAYDAQQMPLISSILFNRIHSSSFPFINCDSTGTYLESIRPNVPTNEQYEHLTAAYDTYVKTGLPVGAICNPGADAISAAMHPDSSDYYYFLHDSSGRIYVARTAAEHEANIRQYLNN